jgi:hypothetical protein
MYFRTMPGRFTTSSYSSSFGFCCNNLQNHRLPIGNQRPLIARQRREERQFHSLHGGFDAAQRVVAQRDFMRGEDRPQLLFLAIALEFGEGELVEFAPVNVEPVLRWRKGNSRASAPRILSTTCVTQSPLVRVVRRVLW